MKRNPPPGVPRSNVKTLDYDGIVIQDVRGHETMFSLEVNGFAFDTLQAVNDFDTPGATQAYLDQVREYLSKTLHCDDVRVYEFKVSSHNDADKGPSESDCA